MFDWPKKYVSRLDGGVPGMDEDGDPDPVRNWTKSTPGVEKSPRQQQKFGLSKQAKSIRIS